MENVREFHRSDRVRVDNCYAWEIGFHSDVARRDILIPGGAKGYALLTVDMIEEEILKQNGFFVGLDGLGDHSGLRICDPEMYKFLFRCEDHTHHIRKEAIVEWLKLSTKAKYKDAIEEIIALRNSSPSQIIQYISDFVYFLSKRLNLG